MKTAKNKIGKTLSLILGILMAGTCVLSSCSKDDGEGNGNSGYVTLDGTKYSMENGATYFDIQLGDVKNTTLSLYNGPNPRRHFNITFAEKHFAELNSGTYTFKEYLYPNASGNYDPGVHFAETDFQYNCTGMQIESCAEAILKNGTVTITKDGNNITIDLEGTTDKGAVKAYYQGSIKEFGSVDF